MPTKLKTCPNCGEPLKRVRIVYGLPTPEALADPNVVLGGCDPDGPTFACAHCHGPLWSALADDRPRFRPVDPSG